jgi:FHA domain-containing protein/double zinc ribbon protein
MIRCPRCGNELPDGVSFCDACGAPIKGVMPQASPVYPPYSADPAPSAGAAPAGATTVCPVCGAPVIPGEAFCDNCGSSLLGNAGVSTGMPAPVAPAPGVQYGPPPVPAPAPAAPVPPVAPAPVAPSYAPAARLLINSTRAEIPLPQRNDLVVGREDPMSNSYPDVDLNPHGALELGVSRRHALISRSGDQYYVEDLNSVNGTLLNQRRIPPRTRMPLQSGDQMMFGRLGVTFEIQ